MTVHHTSAMPAPKDRVIMVIDMNEAMPSWNTAAWCDEYGAWCVADTELLQVALENGDVGMSSAFHIDNPTHWMPLPELPA